MKVSYPRADQGVAQCTKSGLAVGTTVSAHPITEGLTGHLPQACAPVRGLAGKMRVDTCKTFSSH